MKQQVENLSKWCYEGLWGGLTRWFRVPRQPPSLPTTGGVKNKSFKPSPGFLKHLKFKFWLVLIIVDVAIVIGWFIIAILNPLVGLLLFPIALLVAIVPDVIAFLAMYLRYDTTWYVMSDRSLRIRRGIWIIHETTITYENIQNVKIRQGPLQRWFGIANVIIETAGGGGEPQQGQSSSMAAHYGLIEGVDNAPAIREALMNRLGISMAAGLGDEVLSAGEGWSQEHVETLVEIRDYLSRHLNRAV